MIPTVKTLVVILMMTLIAPSLARATSLQLVDSVSFAAIGDGEAKWRIKVRFRLLQELEEVTFRLAVTEGFRAEQPAPYHTQPDREPIVELDIPITRFRLEPGHDGLTVVLHVIAQHGRGRATLQADFAVTDGSLSLLSAEEAERRVVVRELENGTEVRFDGHVLARPNLAGDSRTFGDLPKHLRDELEQKLEAKLGTESISVIQSPLSVEQPSVNAAAGCSSEHSAGSSFASLLLTLPLVLWLLARRRRRLSHASKAALTLGVLGTLGFGESHAATRCFWGYAAFWDSRATEWSEAYYVQNSYDGFRLQPCDESDDDCDPWAEDCCYTELRGVNLHLRRELNGVTQAVVDFDESSHASGNFVLCDAGWQPQFTYSIGFEYTHLASAPAYFQLRTASGNGPVITWVSVGPMNSVSHPVGILSANAAFDTTSLAGRYATHWTSAFETFESLIELGETRFQRSYGSSNSYDRIVIRASNSYTLNESGCDSLIRLIASHHAGPHEIGHIALARAIGCQAAFADFVIFDPHNVYHNTEQGALLEGFANFIGHVWAFDEGVAATEDVVQVSAPCQTITHENDLVHEFNVANALWDLVDADDGYTDGLYTDQSFVTVEEIVDAFLGLSLEPGSAGANQTGSEYYVTPSGSTCSQPSVPEGPPTLPCPTGQSCGRNGFCYAGDPHGENLRDVIHFLPSEIYALLAMESGTCVGTADDVSPFSGGYRMY